MTSTLCWFLSLVLTMFALPNLERPVEQQLGAVTLGSSTVEDVRHQYSQAPSVQSAAEITVLTYKLQDSCELSFVTEKGKATIGTATAEVRSGRFLSGECRKIQTGDELHLGDQFTRVAELYGKPQNLLRRQDGLIAVYHDQSSLCAGNADPSSIVTSHSLMVWSNQRRRVRQISISVEHMPCADLQDNLVKR
jgi:hypothetical protein